jgi:hypothetical protein
VAAPTSSRSPWAGRYCSRKRQVSSESTQLKLELVAVQAGVLVLDLPGVIISDIADIISESTQWASAASLGIR